MVRPDDHPLVVLRDPILCRSGRRCGALPVLAVAQRCGVDLAYARVDVRGAFLAADKLAVWRLRGAHRKLRGNVWRAECRCGADDLALPVELRHARQLMLRAEGSDVRAYASCAAALADPLAIASDCVIADVNMGAIGGFDLLRLMRTKGWDGAGILLADVVPPSLRAAGRDERWVVIRSVGLDDRQLLKAIDTALGRTAADYA